MDLPPLGASQGRGGGGGGSIFKISLGNTCDQTSGPNFQESLGMRHRWFLTRKIGIPPTGSFSCMYVMPLGGGGGATPETKKC